MGPIVDGFMEWLVFAPNLAAMVIILTLGEIAKKLILGPKYDWPKKKLKNGTEVVAFKGFKGVYVVTYRSHAILVGCLIGGLGFLVGLPLPETFGEPTAGAAMLNYGGAGAAAMVGHSLLMGQGKSARDLIMAYLQK